MQAFTSLVKKRRKVTKLFERRAEIPQMEFVRVPVYAAQARPEQNPRTTLCGAHP